MYMRKCGLSCHPASICLSIMLLDCIHVAEDIVQLLVRLDRPITLVFWPPVPIPNFKGNPITGGTKYTGWENWRFSR